MVVANICPEDELVNRVLTFWSPVSSAAFGQRARYQSLCSILRRSRLCLVRSSSAYEANIHLVPGPSRTGLCGIPGMPSRVQTQVGHMIETQVDLAYRGGILISSRLIWPAVTASRYSAIRSMCQFSR